jgi:hypothetical protein
LIVVFLVAALLGLGVWATGGMRVDRLLPVLSPLAVYLVSSLMAATVAFVFGFLIPRRFWLWGLVVASTYPLVRTWEEMLLFRSNPCFGESGQTSCYRDLFTPGFIPVFVFFELADVVARFALCLGGAALGAGLQRLMRRSRRRRRSGETSPAR